MGSYQRGRTQIVMAFITNIYKQSRHPFSPVANKSLREKRNEIPSCLTVFQNRWRLLGRIPGFDKNASSNKAMPITLVSRRKKTQTKPKTNKPKTTWQTENNYNNSKTRPVMGSRTHQHTKRPQKVTWHGTKLTWLETFHVFNAPSSPGGNVEWLVLGGKAPSRVCHRPQTRDLPWLTCQRLGLMQETFIRFHVRATDERPPLIPWADLRPQITDHNKLLFLDSFSKCFQA